MRCILIVFWALCGLGASEAAIERFQEAMAGADYQAKRAAITALSSIEDDDAVFPLLVQALGDRQARKNAISALRSRAGLAPNSRSSGYPGYPESDDASGWNAWLAARQKDIDTQKAIEEAQAEAEEALAKAEEAAEESGEEDLNDDADDSSPAPSKGEIPPPPPIDAVYGKPDRIIFKDGSILIGYVTVKRKDLTGALTSIHVVHLGNAGEEDIEAALITRLQEDF